MSCSSGRIVLGNMEVLNTYNHCCSGYDTKQGAPMLVCKLSWRQATSIPAVVLFPTLSNVRACLPACPCWGAPPFPITCRPHIPMMASSFQWQQAAYGSQTSHMCLFSLPTQKQLCTPNPQPTAAQNQRSMQQPTLLLLPGTGRYLLMT